jgi:RNA polymerase sigma factor (sigma-70 family)
LIRIEDAPLYSWNPQWSPVGTRIAFFDDSGLRTLRAGPSEALERREVRVLLQKAIEDLSPIYREVLVLRDIEELSIEETAGVLAISISSVKGATASGPYHGAKGAHA